jgi:hypothetical protein
VDVLLAGIDSQIDLAQQIGNFPASHIKTQEIPSQEIPVEEIEKIETPTEAVETPSESAEILSEELLREPSPTNLEDIFPSQSSQVSADSFLADLPTVIPTPISFSAKPIPKIPSNDPLDIEDLLSTFEDKNI